MAFGIQHRLERQPQADHEIPSVLGGSNLGEAAWRRIGQSYRVELGVVPRIERIGSELQIGSFAQLEGLVHRQVPIISAWPADEVA